MSNFDTSKLSSIESHQALDERSSNSLMPCMLLRCCSFHWSCTACYLKQVKDSNKPEVTCVFFRNPVTHIRPDYDMFWDFLSLRAESTHTTLMMFSDRGIPNSYRHMHGYGVNTFAFVNAHGTFNYCKFHYLTNQGNESIFIRFLENSIGRI